MATETTTAAEAEVAETPAVETTEEKVEELKNPLEMSDEEFLKTAAPPKEKEEEKETPAEEKTEGSEKVGNDSKPLVEEVKEPGKEPEKKEPSAPGSKVEAKETKAEPKAEEKPVDYEDFFKQVMTPFKANGKTFEVKSPEEAIRLMQKGAGYGRKLQDMQPHLKVLRMLEKNNLLDEGKLSYLIDINQKKPDAIKKLIKDSGIDTLDLNPDDKVTYTPTNHAVTDAEVTFHQALAEVQAQPGGHETLTVISQTWDQESKALLWESPELFNVIQVQRENGIYDQIASEIERQKLLGTMENKTPFLQAYKIAGDHLVKTNGFKQTIQTQQEARPAAQVIATRTAVPKSQAQNGDKAAAAAPSKAVAASKPNLTVNPLEMADDDFMKQFNGRF